MIIVKSEKGEFKYTYFQWHLAWWATFIIGVIVGAVVF